MDGVVLIGRFSKTLSASVRCDFVAAKPDLMERLIDLKIATMFGGDRLNEEVVHAALSDGGYRQHADTLRARLELARRDVGGRLRALGIVPWTEPQAGMFLRCQLPDGIDAANLTRKALPRISSWHREMHSASHRTPPTLCDSTLPRSTKTHWRGLAVCWPEHLHRPAIGHLAILNLAIALVSSQTPTPVSQLHVIHDQ